MTGVFWAKGTSRNTTNNMTIWQATQELDIDNLKTQTGKIISVMDMITSGDDFLQTDCIIECGCIFVGSVKYADADADDPQTTNNMSTTKKPEIMSHANYLEKLFKGFRLEIMDETLITNPCHCGAECAPFYGRCETCTQCLEDCATEYGMSHIEPEVATFDVSNYAFYY